MLAASGRGDQYDSEALAAKYGMDLGWAGRRISDAFAFEHTRKNAAALIQRYVRDGRPIGPESVQRSAAELGVRPDTVNDLIADVAQHDVIVATRTTVPYSAAQPAERYARTEDWAALQITAALIRETLAHPRVVHHKFGLSRTAQRQAVREAVRTFALRTPFDDLHRRRLINAGDSGGTADYERELDTDDSDSDDSDDLVRGIRVTDLSRRFGVAVDSVEQQLSSAARHLARAAADGQVPYSATELGERFGKDSRWGFDRIGAAMRADAGDDRVDTAASAQRYGISVAAVEHQLVADGLADVRAAGDRIVYGYDGPGAAGWEQQLRELGLPRTLEELTGPLGLGREEGLFWIGAALLAGQQPLRSTETVAQQYGIGEAEAEHLVQTLTTVEALAMMVRSAGRAEVVQRLSARTGRTEKWVDDRREEAALYYLRGAGERSSSGDTFTAASLLRLATTFEVDSGRLRDRVNSAAEAELAPDPAGPAPYSAEELAERYHMVVRWGEDRISRAARDDARAAVRDGAAPHAVEALARRRGIGRDVAERAIAAAVLDDAQAAGRSHAIAEFAQGYGLDTGALDRHRDALARLDVREAADRVQPIGDGVLAEKYGRSRSWALEQIDAAAGEFLADAALAVQTTHNDLAAMFG
ncbi:hypothetical protein GCM10027271_59320 [Saccharopolyspora gloriosae]|uniref:Uncharacterized protein n=1 Tax=Saccharopolyspora gloriosae TaxID=455344 RepID=A0A840N8Q5_9PSEU|nr:hypothetical protein [Saccharopolyspora gloriosae]MBB5068014.1 hypothetical protein [Saccharopolyspora gloriosae]